MRKSTATIFIALMMAATVACSSGQLPEQAQISSSQQAPVGAAQIKIDYADEGDISWFTVSVSAPEMETITETFSPSGALEAIIYNIPAGSNRLFTVSAYTAGTLMIFAGSATSDIADGATASVSITLVETNPATETLGAAQVAGFNILPTIDSLTASSETISVGETSTLTVVASDVDGDALTYTWSTSAGSFSSTTAAITTWTAPSTAGAYAISITVDDGRGGEAAASITITVEEEPAVDIPFGFWGLNGFHTAGGFADVQDRFGITIFQVASDNPSWTVGTFLPLIRSAGLTVTLRMTSNPDYSTSFNLATWKTKIDTWVGSGVQEFIDDGTLTGHMLLDDIYNFTGADPTAAELDEMARYSKEKLPGLFTFVREQASNAPVPVSGAYQYVDAFVNQYASFSDGNINDYVQDNVAAAESLNVGLIMGLNLCDGGDGSSGQRGWRTDRVTYAMSAEEITTYGETLLSVPDVLMFLMWEYDGLETWSDGITIGSDYFDQPDLQTALYDLSRF